MGIWQRRSKATQEIEPISDYELRRQLRQDYRHVNAIIKTMTDHPGEWHYGRFYEYRYLKQEREHDFF